MIPGAAPCFVSGTDTGVGKTHVCGALLRRWAKQNPYYIKPLQTGGASGDDDRNTLSHHPGFRGETLFTYSLPRSPYAAAKAQGLTIRPGEVVGLLKSRMAQHPLVVVEGAGGVLVPITEDYFMADLMKDLGLPVWLVARAGLGTVNHSLLAAEALMARGLSLAALVLNPGPGGQVGDLERENRAYLARRLPCPAFFESDLGD